MTEPHRIVSLDDIPGDSRHGAEIRALLGPKTAGATSGFMGVAIIHPGEVIREHYHPYSEEFSYLVSGTLTARVDGVDRTISARQGMLVPINTKHRLQNDGDEDAFLVFAMSPLAPDPSLGHVSTEAPD